MKKMNQPVLQGRELFLKGACESLVYSGCLFENLSILRQTELHISAKEMQKQVNDLSLTVSVINMKSAVILLLSL